MLQHISSHMCCSISRASQDVESPCQGKGGDALVSVHSPQGSREGGTDGRREGVREGSEETHARTHGRAREKDVEDMLVEDKLGHMLSEREGR